MSHRRRVAFYPLALYVGITTGAWATLAAARSVSLDTARVLAALLILLVLALLGARLLYVAPRWPSYAAHPARVFRFAEGGASMIGGLLLAGPCSLVLLPSLSLPVGRFWDVATFTMIPALVVTRLGCLAYGCCSGRPTQAWYGVVLSDHEGVRTRRVPLPAIDAAFGLVLLIGASWLWWTGPADGVLVLSVVASYFAGRVLMDPLRQRHDALGTLSLTRVLAGLLAVASTGALALLSW